MDTFDRWFSRFLYATEIILLLASMPHIAAWFAHFDNPSDTWSGIYAWSIGFGLAFAIDGVSFMLLLAIMRMVKSGKTKSGWTMFGLFSFMLFIALLSWGINWQYDVQNASNAFAKADAIQIASLTLKSLNPIIGGAFQILILAYTLIGKAMQTEVKVVRALSEEEFQQKLKRIAQEKALKEAQKGPGFFEKAREVKVGISGLIRSENDDELIEENGEENARNPLGKFEENDEELPEENGRNLPRKTERITGPLAEESSEENGRNPEGILSENRGESRQESGKNLAIDSELIPLISRYPNSVSLLTTSETTVHVSEVAKAFDIRETLVRNRVKNGKIRKTKSPEKVYKNSVILWAKDEMLSRRNLSKNQGGILEESSPDSSQEKTSPDRLQMTVDFLKNGTDYTDESLANHLGLQQPASALFWRLKALELLRK